MVLWDMVFDLFIIDTFHWCNDEYFELMSDMFPIPLYIKGDNDNVKTSLPPSG